jgi:integrase
MRNGYAMSSVHRQSGKPNWFCSFTDRHGKRRFRSTSTGNRREAEKVCAGFQKREDAARSGRLNEDRARRMIEEHVAEIVADLGSALPNYTVKSWFDSWLASRTATRAPATVAQYEGVIRQFLDCIGSGAKRSLASLRSSDVQAYRDALAVRVSCSRVNTHLKVLRVALKGAVRQGVFDRNPAGLVENLDVRDKQKRRPFTRAELDKLLAVATDDWRTMIVVGLYTGLRLLDAARLTWANIDLGLAEYVVETRKTGRVQNHPLAKPLLGHLESLPSADKPDAPVCPSLFGLAESALSNQFFGIMAAAGLVQARAHVKRASGKGRGARRTLSELSFHSLRYTATSMLKNAGVSDVVARDIIGHESQAISRSYTVIDMDTKRKAVNSMPDLL